MVVDLYNAMLLEVHFKKKYGGGRIWDYFQKSGHARTPLNGSTLESTLQYA
jgi:hypothetical protein